MHTGQAESEARNAAIGEKIDGKIERVEMYERLKALREQEEVAVTYAAALQPEQL